jgi:NAD(P)H dehydrogenase (quinone)
MASAVAEGAREAGAPVDIKRVPELVPDDVASGAQFKLDQAAPIAKVDDLGAYDAIIIGAGGDGRRQPTANELTGARYQGRKIAEVANELHG